MSRTKMVSVALASAALLGLHSAAIEVPMVGERKRMPRPRGCAGGVIFRRVGDAACTGAEMEAKRKAWAKAKPRPANASKKSRARRASGGGK